VTPPLTAPGSGPEQDLLSGAVRAVDLPPAEG
jgi:hypothetical protein